MGEPVEPWEAEIIKSMVVGIEGIVQRAVLAERERCAKIAETALPTRYAPDRPGWVDVPATGAEIASLIRFGSPASDDAAA